MIHLIFSILPQFIHVPIPERICQYPSLSDSEADDSEAISWTSSSLHEIIDLETHSAPQVTDSKKSGDLEASSFACPKIIFAWIQQFIM